MIQSLDIEGAELEVLYSIPWDLVDIRVFSVEINKMSDSVLEELTSYMKDNGYKKVANIRDQDWAFAHQSWTKNL